jgi:hypothetical protein
MLSKQDTEDVARWEGDGGFSPDQTASDEKIATRLAALREARSDF